jgi:hypothetical protein
MAEITKITTPLIPQENVGNRYKPTTDQAFDLTDPSRVHRPGNDGAKILDSRTDSQALRDSFGRAALFGLLSETNDLAGTIKRLALLIETGLSTSETLSNPEARAMLESMYVPPQEVLNTVLEQDKASVLFKGEAFDVLRDLASRFADNPRVAGAIANLLKAFELNVNTENSIRTILVHCENILDYLFSGDKAQFTEYLNGLAETLLPQQTQNGEAANQTQGQQPAAQGEAAQGEAAQAQNTSGERFVLPQARDGAAQTSAPPNANQPAAQGEAAQTQNTSGERFVLPQAQDGTAQTSAPPNANQPAAQNTQPGTVPQSGQAAQSAQTAQNTQNTQQAPANAAPIPQREMAQILKNNLLPLLGEIVVKYGQSERIRDHVMVVVHNTVRVDQGTPEALRESVNKLVRELRQVANLPEGFARSLTEAVMKNVENVRQSGNQVMERMTEVISEALRSDSSTPAVVRQAETLLMSLLQNQSSVMNVLHFVLPMQTPEGQMIAEMYVDPDSEESAGRGGGKQSRKIFLSFESPAHGSFELSFLQTGEYVDFAMWCPEPLVNGLSGMKRHFANIMQTYGFTMNSFSIDEFREPQSMAEVFPNLLDRRVGIDVRI